MPDRRAASPPPPSPATAPDARTARFRQAVVDAYEADRHLTDRTAEIERLIDRLTDAACAGRWWAIREVLHWMDAYGLS